MKQYNRALDYTVLALSELKKGKPVLAARLLASAAKQPDADAAIAILEASNAHAYKISAATKKSNVLSSKKRLTASDEFPFEDEVEDEVEAEMDDLSGDPLDDVKSDEDEEITESAMEEEPSAAMAKVLSRMVRNVRK
jgi:hypothetical protein